MRLSNFYKNLSTRTLRSFPKRNSFGEAGFGVVEMAIVLALIVIVAVVPLITTVVPELLDARSHTGAYEALASYQHFPMGWMSADGDRTIDTKDKIEGNLYLMAWQLQKNVELSINPADNNNTKGFCSVLLGFNGAATAANVIAAEVPDINGTTTPVNAINSCGAVCKDIVPGFGTGIPNDVKAEFANLANKISTAPTTVLAVGVFALKQQDIYSIYPGHFEAIDDTSRVNAGEPCPEQVKCVPPAPGSLPQLYGCT